MATADTPGPTAMAGPTLRTTRHCPYKPPEQHARIRDTGSGIAQVTLSSGRVTWALGRLEHIRAMLTDPRFSSDRRNPNHLRFTREQGAVSLVRRSSIMEMELPKHGPARKAVIAEFTVRRMAPACARASNRSSTSTSTRPWPGRAPPTWCRPCPFRCLPWSSASSSACPTTTTTSLRDHESTTQGQSVFG